jgi:hypothetical protein
MDVAGIIKQMKEIIIIGMLELMLVNEILMLLSVLMN